MSAVLTLPRLGETMEDGKVVAWLVAPGAPFRRGDALLEVETDKTVVEVPALADGELAEILAPEGAQVRVGASLARLVGAEEPDAAPRIDPAPLATSAPAPAPKVVLPMPSTGLRATPLARRLAREAGIDLRDVRGTGRRGRIERADIEHHVGAPTDARANGLAYSLTGPDTGARVVLLHGFAGDHTLWAAPAAGLARAGRRVLSPDLPGHGATDAEAATPAELSTGLADLIAETLDGPAHIIAHSLGAVPATALANAGAAQSLTLVAPAGLGLGVDRTFVHGLAVAKSAGEVAHLLQRMTETPLALSAEALTRIAESLGQGRLIALADAIVGAAGQMVSLRADLARLAETIPIRIIAPHRDRIFDWRDMVTVSPRIALHHLPNAGHMAWWDAQRDVLDILRKSTDG
ncbi:MAG: alpha/beta fold hydrolase [Pseudomonadota bacterium]